MGPLRSLLATAGLAPAANVQRLLNSGRPSEAAAQAVNLAREAEERGRPRQAANLRALAAHALAASGDETGALAQAEEALDLFERQGMADRAGTFADNVARAFRSHGMDAAARKLESRGGGPVEDRPGTAQTARAGTVSRGRLPAKCPGCGAPARPDEVEWLDDRSAECGYCGSVLQTTE